MAELRKQNKTLYKSVLSNHSAVLAQDQIVMIIELYLEVPSIYFPVTLDSRGRLYCLPDYFNYQGQELARGLLLFSNPSPLLLSDVSAREYLQAYGANSW